MSHPFIDSAEIQKLTMDEIQAKITDLNKKLSFAYSMSNRALIYQVGMVLETYRAAASTKLNSTMEKLNIKDNVSIK